MQQQIYMDLNIESYMKDMQLTADFVRGKWGEKEIQVGMVLGSGLGSFAEKIRNAVSIPYTEIPKFPA